MVYPFDCPLINMARIPLGETRGWIDLTDTGEIDFALVYKDPAELYPGEVDSVTFTPDDLPVFEMIVTHLRRVRALTEAEARNSDVEKRPAENTLFSEVKK